ncbi:carbohydrate ABC transporter permease, partial [Streptomyces violaceoruber]
MITKEAPAAAPAPTPVAPAAARPGKKRPAWDEVPRWQIYLPLGI